MSKSKLPTVSVIISHLNSARTLRNCLSAVANQDYPNESYDVCVVDGGSSDGSQEIVKAMVSSRLKLLVEPACSEAEGHIIGVQQTHGEIIMFTNSDIYVPPNWISKHVSWQMKGYDLVGGRPFWGGDKYSLVWNASVTKEVIHSARKGLGLGFSNCSVRRSTYKNLGGIKNLRSQHDTEFALRAELNGVRMVLDPDIEVYHDHPFKSAKLSYLRSFGYARNHIQVMKLVNGRVVSGSGHPAFLSPGAVLKDVLGLNAVEAYTMVRRKKLREEERIGFLEFLMLCFLTRRLGQYLGTLWGSFHSTSGNHGLIDLHMQIENRGVLRPSTI